MADKKKSPQQVAKDLELLKNSGYAIPLPLSAYVKQQELKSRGIKQYWRCGRPNCGFEYEAVIPITTLHCPKGHLVRKVWDL